MVFVAVVDAKETSKKNWNIHKNIREKGHIEHNCNIKSYLKIFSKSWEFRRQNLEV